MENSLVNKKVYLNYEITEKLDAGIELFGYEVKSVKAKLGGLGGAHVTVRGGEAYLLNSFIPPYQPANSPKDYDPYRNRKLLLTRKEINYLAGVESTKGLTVVPISMYNLKGKIKVQIGIAKGKKKFDKRQDLKKRTVERETRRDYSDR